MKSIYLLIATVALSFNAYPQTNLSEVRSVNYYGVDFSKVVVYNATESPANFIKAFYQINTLILSEPNKYDMSALGKPIDIIDIESVLKLNENIDEEGLVRFRTGVNRFDEEQLQAMVGKYNLKEKEGVGLVLIAEQLDKPDATGTFNVVFFDIATREIIKSTRNRGSAGGAGLRNYWANSIAKIIKQSRR
ncbi:MAG: hypothetical protein FWG22_06530 [Prolixibacteraceae bacterium]|nr:hypothetical protein [Prolixibacteraceae bacterium]